MRADGCIPILLYHSVSDDAHPAERRWTVSPKRFAEHVAVIAGCGRTPLTITQLAQGLLGQRPLPERPMAVTFDDGYRNTLDALERLWQQGIPATVYVTTGYLGRQGMLTSPDIGELATAGGRVEIGAHGVTHTRLDEVRADEVRRETRDSRLRLEQLMRAPCRSFAYPYGNHDRETVRAVRSAGYTSAVAVRDALSHPRDDVFALARVTITADSSAARVAAILQGDHRLAHGREALRTWGYRRLRRIRRRVAAPSGATR